MLKEMKETQRTQILNRYWQLARLEAEETKGNIMGQIKALEAICALTLKPAEPEKVTRTTPHQIYQASWRTDGPMNEPEGDLPQ